MNIATATTERRRLTADEAFDAISRRKVGLTAALGLWVASSELRSERKVGRPAQRLVSATASTPIGAVEKLLEKLAAEPTARRIFDEAMIDD